jgi:uncharacterized repeat protein (TIGR03806 family)
MFKVRSIWLALIALPFLLSSLLGCGYVEEAPNVRFFTSDNYPSKLSDWGILRASSRASQQLQLPASSHVYDLNTALFTDYALKLRTLYIPPDQAARYAKYDAFELPTGSIISKTFLYETDSHGSLLLAATWDGDPDHLDMTNLRLIETRLLVKQADGWDALAYIWRDGEAYLNITGDLISLPMASGEDLNYLVPSRNQCASCHATDHTSGEVQPIGIKARHLHRPDPIHGQNQLTAWAERGQLLDLPALDQVSANAHWLDDSASLNHRARSYLDINCGHCHNPQGAADTSGLLLDYQDHSDASMGVCKAPIAAGRGSGGFLYSIVPGSAATSIMSFRMSTTSPATMMPELGRSLVHTQGYDLISAWIDAMSGVCR